MKPIVKKVLLGVAGLLGLASLGAGGYAFMQASAFDASMDKVWDVPLPKIERSTDDAVLARGKHLVDSIAGCASKDCHGADLAGGNSLKMGPLATLTGPNLTPAGVLGAYSDAELARLIRHGIKKDGRSLRFMPVEEINWLPDDEIVAIVSYLRTAPPISKPNGPVEIGLLGKILDRQDKLPIDVARRIEHGNVEVATAKPTPDAAYGKYVARLCTGCHGKTLSGGPIPGAPPDMPVPLNATPHETGIKGWTFEDFDKMVTTGVRKNGAKLDPFMPVENLAKMDDTEKHALFAYLMSIEPKPLGNR